MADIKAPGLNWRTRQDGRRVAYWVAAHDYVKRGYQPSTVRIYFDPTDPGHQAHIVARCHMLQAEMLRWSEGAPRSKAPWDGTLAGLMAIYETDEHSPYRELEPITQKGYSKHMRILGRRVGEVYIDETSGADVRRWYKNMVAETSKSYAYLTISILKSVISYGMSLGRGYEACAALRAQLSATRFENGRAREQQLTYEQLCLFRPKAHEMGMASMALGLTLQFEGDWRPRDVIGRWIDEGDERRWEDGLTWTLIDADGVLHRTPSKTRKRSAAKTALRISDYPDLVEEMAYIPPERRVGPIVINEHTGLPYTSEQYRANFRRIARACGIPDEVWSMDARAGAITEAYESGATTEGAMALAGHTQPSTSRRYLRRVVKQSSAVAKLRVGSRTNGKPET
jgi:hypothetical protein